MDKPKLTNREILCFIGGTLSQEDRIDNDRKNNIYYTVAKLLNCEVKESFYLTEEMMKINDYLKCVQDEI